MRNLPQVVLAGATRTAFASVSITWRANWRSDSSIKFAGFCPLDS